MTSATMFANIQTIPNDLDLDSPTRFAKMSLGPGLQGPALWSSPAQKGGLCGLKLEYA